ncbi:MAG: hypothetical protein KUG74_10850 [Rhodobacteraceae bacterium]|nr:hypothetical protein [Paracoccaceae bacterium]
MRPGYPPPGQAERLAALQAGEAAAQTGDPNAALDAELAALDVGAETPDDRAVRLGEFVDRHFEGEFSDEGVLLAVQECTLFENDCRELFEEPDLVLMDEDAADPGLRQRVENFATVATNDEAIIAGTGEAEERETTVVANDTEVIPATETKLAAVQATETRERAGLAADEENNSSARTRNIEVARDLQTVEELNTEFERIKAANGGSTIAALETLLDAENGLQSPEMQTIVQRAIGTAQALVSALPGREADISRLLDQSGLNLGAASQAEVFASLFTAAEASDEFSEEEVAALRRVVNDHEDIDDGSDIHNAFAEGRETVTDANGNETTVPYDEEHQLDWGGGVSVYPDGDSIRGTANFDGLSFPFEAPASLSGAKLTERLNYSMFNAVNEAAGVTGGTNQGFEVTQGVQALDLSDELFEGQAVREAKLGIENMIDRYDAGAGLLDRQNIQQIAWGHQWLMPNIDVIGDAGFGDNSERARAEALGGRGHDGLIWSADDVLNEANYVVACQFIRDRARTGMAEPDYDALIAHINRVNGERPEDDEDLAA